MIVSCLSISVALFVEANHQVFEKKILAGLRLTKQKWRDLTSCCSRTQHAEEEILSVRWVNLRTRNEGSEGGDWALKSGSADDSREGEWMLSLKKSRTGQEIWTWECRETWGESSSRFLGLQIEVLEKDKPAGLTKTRPVFFIEEASPLFPRDELNAGKQLIYGRILRWMKRKRL